MEIQEEETAEDVVIQTKDDNISEAVPSSIFQLPSMVSEKPVNQFTFQFLKNGLDCIDKSMDIREQLVQYNLTTSDVTNLQFFTFRFHGLFNAHLLSDYELLLKDFFAQADVLHTLGVIGQPTTPIRIQTTPLELNTLTMDLFDRFYQSPIISPDGRIRGCFDETFDGVTVGDLLREMLVNENSENSYLFKESEKKELIYQLFQTFVIGGSLCQPETHIDRYLSITKAFYKELVTVYKDSKTQEARLSGKAFELTEIAGTSLFSGKYNPSYSHCYVIVEPMKKTILIMKNTFHDFW